MRFPISITSFTYTMNVITTAAANILCHSSSSSYTALSHFVGMMFHSTVLQSVLYVSGSTVSWWGILTARLFHLDMYELLHKNGGDKNACELKIEQLKWK